jgi:hypothetical protein
VGADGKDFQAGELGFSCPKHPSPRVDRAAGASGTSHVALAAGLIGGVLEGDMIEIVIDRNALHGAGDLVGEGGGTLLG